MKNSMMTSAAAAMVAALIGLPALAQTDNPASQQPGTVGQPGSATQPVTPPTNGAMKPPAGSTVQPGTTGGSGTGTGIIAGDTSGAVSDTISGGTAAGTYAQGNSGSDHRGSSGWFGLLGLLGLFGLRGGGSRGTPRVDTYAAPEVKTRL